MKIGILGAGAMAAALAPWWVRAGHEVTVAGRSRSRAETLAAAVGADVGSFADVAAFGDVVLLAVRHEGVDSTLDAAGADRGTLREKVVVDCNNPVEIEGFTLAVPAGAGSLFEHIRGRTGGPVVKAFNLAHADVWRRPRTYGGRPLAVPMAGDDTAKRVAGALVASTGCVARDVGGVPQAAYLEAAAAVVIRALFGGADQTTTWALAPGDAA